MSLFVCKMFTFDAAHFLPNHKGKCKNLHGHTWKIKIKIKGDINKDEMSSEFGMIMDFKRLESLVKEYILSKLDHTNLNNIIHNPTAENILDFIVQQLPESVIITLHSIKLYESENSYVEWENPILNAIF